MIQRLEQALLEIDQAKFQEFCTSLIDLKYNPNSISPIGSVTGKLKTRKGQPDCYFKLENGDLIFAEYTTMSALNGRNALMKKLENDVKSCFDGIKDPNSVSKVVLCFTDNLKADEQIHLNTICRSFNEKCEFEILGIRDLANCAKKYSSLASDYLGVLISGQILTPKEFIKRYDRFTFSTPLGNEFIGRTEELADGLAHLTEGDAIVLSGDAGIGKTRLALQIGYEFCKTNQDFEFICISGPGENIFEEMRSTIQPDRKYLILADDANRMSNNYHQLLNLLVETENGNVKIITTVRKYALYELKEKIVEFGVKVLPIENLTRQELSEILTTQCKISNEKAVSRILDIAQENARIAFMCAKIEDNILVNLRNPTHVFEHCYSEILNLLKSCKDYKLTLKSLALLSFCRRIKKIPNNLDLYYSAFGLREDQFWECCIELCEYEIVDLYNQRLAKISDQSLSTFLFREVFFKSGILDFKLILDNFLDKKSFIVDSIMPIVYGFGEEVFIESFKNKTLIPFWEVVKEDDNRAMMFLQIFNQVLPTQTIAYLSRFVKEEQVIKENQEYLFEYTDRDFQFNKDQTLSLLQDFRGNPQQLPTAIELISLYGLRFPEKAAEVAYVLGQGYGIRYEDTENGFQTQHILIDFLTEKSNENDYYKQLAIATTYEIISKTARKSETGESDSNGRLMNIRTYSILDTEVYLALRTKCLQFLNEAFLENREKLLKLIRSVVFEPSLSGMLQSDASVIYPSLFNKLDPNNFKEAKFANELFDLFEKHNLTHLSIDRNQFNHPLHRLSKELFPKETERNVVGYDNIHREKMKDLCSELDLEQTVELIDNILLLRSYEDSRLSYKYNNSIQFILEALAIRNDKSRFIEICVRYIEVLEEFNCYHIFNKYFSNTGNWNELYKILSPKKIELTHTFICFCQTVPEQAIVEMKIHFNLYEEFKSVLQFTEKSLRLNSTNFLSKFNLFVSISDMCQELGKIIITRNIENNKEIILGDNFYKIAEAHIQSDLELYSKLYLLDRKNDTIFDYDGKILESFLIKEPAFMCTYFDVLVDYRYTWYMHDNEINAVWNNQNYHLIFYTLMSHIANNDLSYKAEKFLKQLVRRNDHAEKIRGCFEQLVENYSDDGELMSLVFKICPNQPIEFRLNLLSEFLLKNTNFSDFKKIDLLNKGMLTMSSPGSQVPSKIKEKLKIENIRDLVALLPNQLKYIDHSEYLEKKIHSLDRDIEYAREQEFLWHFD